MRIDTDQELENIHKNFYGGRCSISVKSKGIENQGLHPAALLQELWSKESLSSRPLEDQAH